MHFAMRPPAIGGGYLVDTNDIRNKFVCLVGCGTLVMRFARPFKKLQEDIKVLQSIDS
jgi:hypothetical protein